MALRGGVIGLLFIQSLLSGVCFIQSHTQLRCTEAGSLELALTFKHFEIWIRPATAQRDELPERHGLATEEELPESKLYQWILRCLQFIEKHVQLHHNDNDEVELVLTKGSFELGIRWRKAQRAVLPAQTA